MITPSVQQFGPMPDTFEQVPFGSPGFDPGFADNPEPRCPLLLILDTSGSMQGRPIDELNAGIVTLKDELVADSLAAKRVEVAVVTFGPPRVEAAFQTVDYFQPMTLSAGGDTPMGAAIRTGLDLLRSRKDEYDAAGIASYRPWVFLITDGAPTDEWRSAAAAVREGESANAFSFFAVGVEGAKMDVLGQIATREPLRLKGLRFRDLFVWLSRSMRSVSQSSVGDTVPLENPATPSGRAAV